MNKADQQNNFYDMTRALRAVALGKEITYQSRVASTNDLALDAARQGARHGHLFVTDEQIAGRGRRGRKWESPSGLSLLFSVIIRPQRNESATINWMPLLAGWAIIEALQNVCPLNAALKWPNDIVIPCQNAPGWRKLGGILCESAISALPSLPDYIVVGIGLNINQEIADLPATTKAPATSIKLETNAQGNRQDILRAILECFEARLFEFNAADTRSRLQHAIVNHLSQWWTPDCLLRAQGAVANGRGEEILEGRFDGLDDCGRLKLKTATRGNALLVDAEIISVYY